MFKMGLLPDEESPDREAARGEYRRLQQVRSNFSATPLAEISRTLYSWLQQVFLEEYCF